MSELKNEIESPQDAQRREEGKKGKLWKIEVIAKHGMETKRFARCNLYSSEIMQERERMFQYGILMPIDPGHWIVICPADIQQIDVWRQKNFFADEPFR